MDGRRHVTVMSKDAPFVAKLVNLWDKGSFLSRFVSATGPIYEQQLPVQTSQTPSKTVDAPEPHYRGKAPSKRPNATSNGKGPQVGEKLSKKAACRYLSKHVAYKSDNTSLK